MSGRKLLVGRMGMFFLGGFSWDEKEGKGLRSNRIWMRTHEYMLWVNSGGVWVGVCASCSSGAIKHMVGWGAKSRRGGKGL